MSQTEEGTAETGTPSGHEIEKHDLPYPYDQDLTTIVTRVDRVRPAARAKLANSVQVASYLKAGATLIERNLGLPDGTSPIPPTPHDDYMNDLLAFFFDPINYNTQYGAEMRTRGRWMLDEASFVDVIDRTTYHELQAICGMALFRLQLLMIATAHRNDGIHEVITGNYRGALGPWKEVYRSTFDARGFQLREGVTIDQFTDMVAAVTEGFAVRRIGDPTARPGLDTQEGNLLGMAVLALVSSYLEPKVRPSGRTLRQSFAEVEKAARPQGEQTGE